MDSRLNFSRGARSAVRAVPMLVVIAVDWRRATLVVAVVWHEKTLDRVRRHTDERRFHTRPDWKRAFWARERRQRSDRETEGERKSRRSAPTKCRLNAQRAGTRRGISRAFEPSSPTICGEVTTVSRAGRETWAETADRWPRRICRCWL